MVRKTKEDAEITRLKIIQAAREIFLVKGVSKTSLDQVATHAGVTRGAVYWHFKNKAALFHAMREQVFLPLIDKMEDTLFTDIDHTAPSSIDPLERIENFMLSIINELSDNIVTQETYVVMMTKCEYVDELALVLEEILNNCADIVKKLATTYQDALNSDLVNAQNSAEELAYDTHLFFTGLLHMWVKDTDGKHYRIQAKDRIKTHIKLKRKIIENQ